MGPIASTPSPALPRRRWVVLVGLSVAITIASDADEPPVQGALDSAILTSLDEVARAHRLWVEDHGPGCAREIGHLDPYIHPRTDPWGHALHLECERRSMGRTIVVRVVSSGPDGWLDTLDDATGMDVQTIDHD
jgi:hypothetical protein